MSVLSMEARAKVASCLVDGVSIRATERITGAHRDTVMRFGVALGDGCARLHDGLVRGLPCRLLQCDEAWTFVHTKAARVTPADPNEWGDQYVYIGLDVPSRAIVSYLVGKRDLPHAQRFANDLRGRTTGRPQISTDGFGPYPEAIWQAYGYQVDFGQVVKNYKKGAHKGPDHRYEPPREPFITKTVVAGAPNERDLSTSLVERQNLQLRSCIKRMARLTNAYSKKKSNLDAAVALHVFWYNYGTVHGSLRCTPAMAAGLTRHVWTLEELIAEALAALEAPAPEPVKPPERIAPLPSKPWQKPEQLGLFEAHADGPQLSKTSQDTAPRLRLIKGGLS
jgi:IS1 family transposase